MDTSRGEGSAIPKKVPQLAQVSDVGLFLDATRVRQPDASKPLQPSTFLSGRSSRGPTATQSELS